MMRLIMLAILLSSCQPYEHVGSSADAAGGQSGNLHLAIENNKVVLQRQKLKVSALQIKQLTAVPLSNNDNVRKLGAVFFDLGSGKDSVANLRLSKLQLSYIHVGNTIDCNFSNISLGSNLPSKACIGDTVGKSGGGWSDTSSASEQGQAMRQRILAAPFDLSTTDKYGMNLLHHACNKEGKRTSYTVFSQPENLRHQCHPILWQHTASPCC